MAKQNTDSLEALAAVIAARVNGVKPAKPKLRVVTAPRPTVFDSITRDSILKRVRWLSKAFHLRWMIDQATFNLPNLDCLEDRDLGTLLAEMERARECLADGIPFEDAGLVRSTADDIPEFDL